MDYNKLKKVGIILSDKNLIELGQYIKELRLNKKIKGSELAKKVNVSQSYISDLENGKKKKPSLEILENIIEVLTDNMEEKEALKHYKKMLGLSGLYGTKNIKLDQEASEEVAKFILDSTELEELSSIMKDIVLNGDTEQAKKILLLFTQIILLVDRLKDVPEDLERFNNIIDSVEEIMTHDIFIDKDESMKIAKERAEKIKKQVEIDNDNSVKNWRKRTKELGEPRVPFKNLSVLFKDYQSKLVDIERNLTESFSDASDKLYTKK